MKALLVCMGVIIGQMNTLQDRQVVHLQPHGGAIRTDFGGKLLELLNAPTIIYLPMAPPKLDSQANAWSVDIRNLRPSVVRVSVRPNSACESSWVRLCTYFRNGTTYRSK
jgi:hypothetical protein